MQISPVHPVEPDYPGIHAERRWRNTWTVLFRTRVTLPLCLVFMLNSPGLSIAEPSRDLAGSGRPGSSLFAQTVQDRPCAGAPRPDPVTPIPPPCRGDVAEPPCKGESPDPRLADPPTGVPLILAKDVPLTEFFGRAKEYLGMNIRIRGFLGKMDPSELVDKGFFIYEENGGDKTAEPVGCPLIGDFSSLTQGRRVVVQGTIEKVEIVMENGKVRKYFAMRVEKADPE